MSIDSLTIETLSVGDEGTASETPETDANETADRNRSTATADSVIDRLTVRQVSVDALTVSEMSVESISSGATGTETVEGEMDDRPTPTAEAENGNEAPPSMQVLVESLSIQNATVETVAVESVRLKDDMRPADTPAATPTPTPTATETQDQTATPT